MFFLTLCLLSAAYVTSNSLDEYLGKWKLNGTCQSRYLFLLNKGMCYWKNSKILLKHNISGFNDKEIGSLLDFDIFQTLTKNTKDTYTFELNIGPLYHMTKTIKITNVSTFENVPMLFNQEKVNMWDLKHFF